MSTEYREKLEQIARLVSELHAEGRPHVSTGVRLWCEHVEKLAALPDAEVRSVVYTKPAGKPYVIVSVDVYIHGVEFHAQMSRLATDEEIARADVAAKRTRYREEFEAVTL